MHVTVLSFLLNLGTTFLLHEALGLSEEFSFAIALALVFTTNFLLLRYYIFATAGGSFWAQMSKFAMSTVFFRGFEYALFIVLHTWLGVQYLAAVVGILGVSFVLKFIVNKRMVFESKGTVDG